MLSKFKVSPKLFINLLTIVVLIKTLPILIKGLIIAYTYHNNDAIALQTLKFILVPNILLLLAMFWERCQIKGAALFMTGMSGAMFFSYIYEHGLSDAVLSVDCASGFLLSVILAGYQLVTYDTSRAK